MKCSVFVCIITPLFYFFFFYFFIILFLLLSSLHLCSVIFMAWQWQKLFNWRAYWMAKTLYFTKENYTSVYLWTALSKWNEYDKDEDINMSTAIRNIHHWKILFICVEIIVEIPAHLHVCVCLHANVLVNTQNVLQGCKAIQYSYLFLIIQTGNFLVEMCNVCINGRVYNSSIVSVSWEDDYIKQQFTGTYSGS